MIWWNICHHWYRVLPRPIANSNYCRTIITIIIIKDTGSTSPAIFRWKASERSSSACPPLIDPLATWIWSTCAASSPCQRLCWIQVYAPYLHKRTYTHTHTHTHIHTQTHVYILWLLYRFMLRVCTNSPSRARHKLALIFMQHLPNALPCLRMRVYQRLRPQPHAPCKGSAPWCAARLNPKT